MFLGSMGNRWDKYAISFVALAGVATLGTIVWRRKRREDGLDPTVGWDENDYFSDMVSSLSEAQVREAIETHGLPQDLIHSQAHYIHNNGSDDFVFSAMEENNLLTEKVIYMWDPSNKTAYAIYSLGKNVCGHPTLAHGGISALILDNMAGYAIFKLKAMGAVPDGPAFTVNLNVNYRKPIPSMSTLVCRVVLGFQERKKTQLELQLLSPPDEEGNRLTYCEATALMVTPSVTVQPGESHISSDATA